MSAFPGPANPIFYSQFRIRGGWKTIFAAGAVYGLIIGGLIVLSARGSDPMNYSSAMFGWLDGLLALQVFFLLVFGSSRVSSAVRSDVTDKIIESHRLMPLSAFSAIVGYITGPPIQAISLSIVNVVLGLFTAEAAGFDLQHWLVANIMLAAFALFIWTISVQLAFSTRGGFLLVIIALAIAAISSGSTLVLLPALSVITCPILGRSVFSLQASFTDITFPFAAALLSQFIFGSVFFVAAMRKYRLPEAAGFNATLGLLLLAAWAVISLTGMKFMTEFVSRYYVRDIREMERTQFIASIVVSMLFAIIPISAAARANRDFSRDNTPTSTHLRPIPTWFIALLGTALICLFLTCSPSVDTPRAKTFSQTLLVLLASMISLALLFRWTYLITSKAWIIALIWIILIWLVPLIGDGVHQVLTNKQDAPGIIASLSPIGALVLIWNNVKVPVGPGIAFQWGMILFPAILYFKASRRRARKIKAPPLAVIPV